VETIIVNTQITRCDVRLLRPFPFEFLQQSFGACCIHPASSNDAAGRFAFGG
jgi:hypothetical protein